MSNPTSNFGWQMPTATDLVTDLPADFEVFGQAVDTDLADLNGGTTGQILSKTSATDLDFTWINNDQGDITGVTAGIGISGGGTSGSVTVTNSMATAFTTSGDLIQATGSGTFARLGTGTSGQYLTTNGTTNSWATPAAGGGYTLIAEQTASSNTAIDFTSISTSYKSLIIYWQGVYIGGDSDYEFRLNNDSASNYKYNAIDFTADVVANYGATRTSIGSGNDVYAIGRRVTSTTLQNTSKGYLLINNSNSSTKLKYFELATSSQDAGIPRYVSGVLKGIYNSTTAITQISIVRLSGTDTISNATDTSIQLWGLS